jgi:hypothetical protein
MPILVYHEADSTGRQELTNTVDVSKRGACFATSWLWETGEKIWIEKPGSQRRTLARVAWVKIGRKAVSKIDLQKVISVFVEKCIPVAVHLSLY